jgi:glycosyltransferase involved in cell wall biosynthesis
MTGITVIMPLLLRRPDEHLRAVESVLSQQCPVPVEFLVVDDGSMPVVPPIEGARIVRLPRNYGIAYALNAGLTQAKYNWIARIDGDDLWRPGKLSKQWSMLQDDPDLTLVASGMRLVHPGKPELDRDEVRGGDWPHVLQLTERIGCPFPHGSVLGRRDVFETLGGYPQAAAFQHGEDFALWAQWIRFFKVAICGEIFLEYTVSDGSISGRFTEEQTRASGMARRVLGKTTGTPDALSKLASAMGLSLLETSKTLFTAWRYYDYIVADEELYSPAAALLPDRAVYRDSTGLMTDRFYRLNAKRVAS